jgi:hypothetical protein
MKHSFSEETRETVMETMLRIIPLSATLNRYQYVCKETGDVIWDRCSAPSPDDLKDAIDHYLNPREVPPVKDDTWAPKTGRPRKRRDELTDTQEE